MDTDLKILRDRLEKRREVDTIVKIKVDQLRRERVFVDQAQLGAVRAVAEAAFAKVDELMARLADLEDQVRVLCEKDAQR